MVALPRRIPDATLEPAALRVTDLIPETELRPVHRLRTDGRAGLRRRGVTPPRAPGRRRVEARRVLRTRGEAADGGRPPRAGSALASSAPDDRIGVKGGRNHVPARARDRQPRSRGCSASTWPRDRAGGTSSRSPTRTRRSSTGPQAALAQWGLTVSRGPDLDHVLLGGGERALRLAGHRRVRDRQARPAGRLRLADRRSSSRSSKGWSTATEAASRSARRCGPARTVWSRTSSCSVPASVFGPRSRPGHAARAGCTRCTSRSTSTSS